MNLPGIEGRSCGAHSSVGPAAAGSLPECCSWPNWPIRTPSTSVSPRPPVRSPMAGHARRTCPRRDPDALRPGRAGRPARTGPRPPGHRRARCSPYPAWWSWRGSFLAEACPVPGHRPSGPRAARPRRTAARMDAAALGRTRGGSRFIGLTLVGLAVERARAVAARCGHADSPSARSVFAALEGPSPARRRIARRRAVRAAAQIRSLARRPRLAAVRCRGRRPLPA